MRVIHQIKGNYRRAIKDHSFILKCAALFLNLFNTLLWRVPEQGVTGHVTTLQKCIFAHTVPAYTVILGGCVLVYLMGDRPGPWFHSFFFLTGIALFVATGVIAIMNRLQDPTLGVYPFLIGSVCFVISVLLLVDYVQNVKTLPHFQLKSK